MAITSTGLGSGLDVESLVSSLMAIEQRPLTLMAQKEASAQAKISAYGSLKSVLSSLQTTAQSISTTASFTARKATISNADVATVAATTDAVAGNYKVTVNSLAASQVVASSAFSSRTDAVGSGTITIKLGTYSGGTFTQNASKTPVDITIPSDANTLEDVRDAINDADAGVSASILNDGNGMRLVLSSSDGGTANAMQISVTDGDGNNTDASGLSRLVYDASTGGTSNMTQQVAAADASLTVNGIAITSSSNILTDAIDGVTLNLKSTAVGETATVTVASDTSNAKSGIEKFVAAYNTAVTEIKKQTAYNTETDTAATLNGESTATTLRSKLSSMISLQLGKDVSLSAIGVELQKDGTLKINSDKLTTALNDGRAQKLFVGTDGTDGLAKRMDDMLDGVLDSTNGLLTSRTNGLSASVKALEKQADALATRLESIEARYRKQFTSLDTLMSSMSSTSSYLTQQLANLPTYSS
ncbi:flagellar filament capping protein FliD [Methyloversatilis thermotolerans]|uniref:flagellar filament capping protein FliD n=1 Tax=Methyloversatilis thermotolerans TaxID=1346290 RepID=UPI0003705B3F|nr:flagellar filament capping protein FliD [Methyloversatilis thermotolerans]